MGWQKYFKITGCNRFIYPGVGIIDVNNKNMSNENLLNAYKRNCRYISLTNAGKKKFAPEELPKEVIADEKQIEVPDELGTADIDEKPD